MSFFDATIATPSCTIGTHTAFSCTFSSTITRVESFGFASFNLHVSDGTVLGGIAAGAGSNAANAAARDRIVALLGALVGGQP